MAEKLERAWQAGFDHALDWYGIWKDGVQVIGCMENPISEATPQAGKMRADLGRIERGEE